MTLFLKSTILIVAVTFFASCQSGSDVRQILSQQDSRMAVIDSIANDSSMSKEMIGAMINSNNGKMMMQGNEKMNMMMMENHASMMKMMRNNPAMMQSIMTDMIELCKGDSSMMTDMCKKIMDDPKMMEMMNKMKGMDEKKTDHSAHH
jgi:hypothetical protein